MQTCPGQDDRLGRGFDPDGDAMTKHKPQPENRDRFRKRKIRSQQDRDSFEQELIADMNRAYQSQDWDEYNRIKEILYRAT